jgi:predicted chitinase
MFNILGCDRPPIGYARTSAACKRREMSRRFSVEGLEERALMTTIIPWNGNGPEPTYANLIQPGQYVLTGTVTVNEGWPEFFGLGAVIASNSKVKVTIALDTGTGPGVDAGVDLGDGYGINNPYYPGSVNHILTQSNNSPVVFEPVAYDGDANFSFNVEVYGTTGAQYNVLVNIANEDITPPVQPDISMTSAAITPDDQSVTASYSITGSNLASPATINFYWASGPNIADEIGTPWTVATTATQVGSYTATVPIADLGLQPPLAFYILAVVSSPNADPNHGFASVLAPIDVTLDSAKVVGSQVQFTYTPIGNPGPFSIGLYESAVPTFIASEDTLVTTQTEKPITNASVQDTFSQDFSPNPAQPYLLVVFNPQNFVQQSVPNAPIHVLPAYLFSAAQLQAIMGTRLPTAIANSFMAPLNEALEEFQINTPKREAAILAQMAFESASLTRWHELWNGNPIIYFTNKYEGKKGLGNTEPGDGYLYRGRGPLQITGRDAYTKIGAKIGIDLVDLPNLVDDSANRPDIGFRASAAFWSYYKGPQLFAGNHPNTLADEVIPSTVVRINRLITKVVQGGTDGLPQRLTFYKRALKVLNVFGS